MLRSPVGLTLRPAAGMFGSVEAVDRTSRTSRTGYTGRTSAAFSGLICTFFLPARELKQRKRGRPLNQVGRPLPLDG